MNKTAGFIDSLSEQLRNALPSGFEIAKDDLERIIKASVAASLSRMELVTREEFDVQTAVLARTREKLDALAKKLEQLEHNNQ